MDIIGKASQQNENVKSTSGDIDVMDDSQSRGALSLVVLDCRR